MDAPPAAISPRVLFASSLATQTPAWHVGRRNPDPVCPPCRRHCPARLAKGPQRRLYGVGAQAAPSWRWAWAARAASMASMVSVLPLCRPSWRLGPPTSTTSTASPQVPGQAGPVRARAFHPHPGHRPEPGHPLEQLLVASHRRREGLHAQRAADMVQRGGHVHVEMGVNAPVTGRELPTIATSIPCRARPTPVIEPVVMGMVSPLGHSTNELRSAGQIAGRVEPRRQEWYRPRLEAPFLTSDTQQ
jgi:hypothetical protein